MAVQHNLTVSNITAHNYLAVTPQFQVESKNSSNSTGHGHDKHPGHSSTAVIVATTLGAVLLVVIGLFVMFFLLRRRRRKSSSVPNNRHPLYPFSSTPSPTPSRPWLLRKFWNPDSEDHSSAIDMPVKGATDWAEARNFYHTPRPPRKAVVKKSSRLTTTQGTNVSNGTDTSLSSIRFAAKTERQMEIEERIEELKGKLALLQRAIPTPGPRPDSRTLTTMTHNMRIGRWQNRIVKLQELMTSDWALGRTDVRPKGLYAPESSTYD